jgi:single-strand DNA-binding protein
MANFNRVILIGRLVGDPETRKIQNDRSVTSFALAVSKTFNNRDGEEQEKVSFFDCEMWGKRGEVVAKYLKKGNHIFIEGHLDQDKWQDKDGQNRSKVVVGVENFEFIDGPKNKDTAETPAKENRQANTSKKKLENTPF